MGGSVLHEPRRAKWTRRHRLRLYAAIVSVDLVVAAVALAVVLTGGDDARSAADPAPTGVASAAAKISGPQATILGWAVNELPKSTTLLADTTIAVALRAKGFTVIAPRDATGRTIQFVVSTPALRSQAGHYRAAAAALASSVPVALAGSGRDATDVGQVATLSPATMAADARTRRAAENQLLDNPSLGAAPQAADQLRAGALDLRCATVLALVAATQRVRVERINVVAQEAAAGRPARSLDVTVASTAALKRAVANLSPDYALARWQSRPDGSVRLVWPVDVLPVSGS